MSSRYQSSRSRNFAHSNRQQSNNRQQQHSRSRPHGSQQSTTQYVDAQKIYSATQSQYSDSSSTFKDDFEVKKDIPGAIIANALQEQANSQPWFSLFIARIATMTFTGATTFKVWSNVLTGIYSSFHEVFTGVDPIIPLAEDSYKYVKALVSSSPFLTAFGNEFVDLLRRMLPGSVGSPAGRILAVKCKRFGYINKLSKELAHTGNFYNGRRMDEFIPALHDELYIDEQELSRKRINLRIGNNGTIALPKVITKCFNYYDDTRTNRPSDKIMLSSVGFPMYSHCKVSLKKGFTPDYVARYNLSYDDLHEWINTTAIQSVICLTEDRDEIDRAKLGFEFAYYDMDLNDDDLLRFVKEDDNHVKCIRRVDRKSIKISACKNDETEYRVIDSFDDFKEVFPPISDEEGFTGIAHLKVSVTVNGACRISCYLTFNVEDYFVDIPSSFRVADDGQTDYAMVGLPTWLRSDKEREVTFNVNDHYMIINSVKDKDIYNINDVMHEHDGKFINEPFAEQVLAIPFERIRYIPFSLIASRVSEIETFNFRTSDPETILDEEFIKEHFESVDRFTQLIIDFVTNNYRCHRIFQKDRVVYYYLMKSAWKYFISQFDRIGLPVPTLLVVTVENEINCKLCKKPTSDLKFRIYTILAMQRMGLINDFDDDRIRNAMNIENSFTFATLTGRYIRYSNNKVIEDLINLHDIPEVSIRSTDLQGFCKFLIKLIISNFKRLDKVMFLLFKTTIEAIIAKADIQVYAVVLKAITRYETNLYMNTSEAFREFITGNGTESLLAKALFTECYKSLPADVISEFKAYVSDCITRIIIVNDYKIYMTINKFIEEGFIPYYSMFFTIQEFNKIVSIAFSEQYVKVVRLLQGFLKAINDGLMSSEPAKAKLGIQKALVNIVEQAPIAKMYDVFSKLKFSTIQEFNRVFMMYADLVNKEMDRFSTVTHPEYAEDLCRGNNRVANDIDNALRTVVRRIPALRTISTKPLFENK